MKQTLEPWEADILAAKYKSKCFKLMNETEVSIHARALLVKIYIITGWTLPEEQYLMIFQDQFRKKMTESYSTVNADEVEYAFRTYGTTVKDWGKQMNLSLIDEVMIPYLAARTEVSKLEEQKTLPEPKPVEPEINTEDFIRGYKGRNTPLDLLPEFLYQWLVDNQRLWTPWDEEQNLLDAIAYRKYQIQKGLEMNPGDKVLIREKNEFKEMLQQGFFEGNEKKRIERLAKQILIRDYINAIK
ncbi:hypothetical protein ACX0G7_09825 [Flavitalea antarctica]